VAHRRRSAAWEVSEALRLDGQIGSRRVVVPELPESHRTQIHSTNPLERLNAEVKRRTMSWDLPNDASITRLVGALLLEQNDEWQLQRRTCSLKACRLSATIKPLGCPQWSTEHEFNRAKTHDSYTTRWGTILQNRWIVARQHIGQVHLRSAITLIRRFPVPPFACR